MDNQLLKVILKDNVTVLLERKSGTKEIGLNELAKPSNKERIKKIEQLTKKIEAKKHTPKDDYDYSISYLDKRALKYAAERAELQRKCRNEELHIAYITKVFENEEINKLSSKFQEAINAFYNGNTKKTLELLDNNVSEELRLKLLIEERKGNDIIGLIESLLKLEMSIKNLKLAADFYRRKGNFEKAVACYNLGIKASTEETEIAILLNDLAAIKAQLGDKELAEEYFEKSLKVLKKEVEKDKSFRKYLANAYHNFGQFLYDLDEDERCQEAWEKAKDYYKELVDEGEINDFAHFYASALRDYGKMYLRLNEAEQAVEVQEEVCSFYEKLYENEPEKYVVAYAGAIDHLAYCEGRDYEINSAMDSHKAANRIYLKHIYIDPKRIAEKIGLNYKAIAEHYLNDRKSEYATDQFYEIVELFLKMELVDIEEYLEIAAIFNDRIANTYNNYFQTIYEDLSEKDLEKLSGKYAKKALNLRLKIAKVTGKPSPQLAQSKVAMAEKCIVKKQFDKAEGFFDEALNIFSALDEQTSLTYISDITMLHVKRACLFDILNETDKVKNEKVAYLENRSKINYLEDIIDFGNQCYDHCMFYKKHKNKHEAFNDQAVNAMLELIHVFYPMAQSSPELGQKLGRTLGSAVMILRELNFDIDGYLGGKQDVKITTMFGA